MSFYKINPADVETFSVVTNPSRQYSSSSIDGVDGSIYVFARRSNIEKDIDPASSFVDNTHDDSDVALTLRTAQQVGKYANLTASVALDFVNSTIDSFPNILNQYLSKVNQQSTSQRKQTLLEIERFTPSFTLTENTLRKLLVKEQLSSYYRTSYPSAHWAYTNYHSLNFFTSSAVPESSCLLYPNIDGGQSHVGFVSGVYTPSGSVTFDFYIKPSYRPDSHDGQFKAGTIFHLSSTYAVSLVTGSRKDHNGLPVGFRVQLQLSHSADIAPSLLRPESSLDKNRVYFSGGSTTKSGYSSADLAFISDDNSLLWNNWHHVVVRWGTNLINEGTGSFNIDGVDKGTFVIPSSTIAPRIFAGGGQSDPSALVVGNYFNGFNSGDASLSYFFSVDPALREGLIQLDPTPGVNEPNVSKYSFNHPLNAELHDLSIKRYYMSDYDIKISSSVGPKSIDGWTAFYLPPFFIESSSLRQFVGDSGGILQTPFFEIDGSTNDPFNVALSFGVGGHYINIENFLKDFATHSHPRVHHMSGVAMVGTTDLRSANDFLYQQQFVRRRNLLLLPCDDGMFVPGFELLASETMRRSAVDDLNVEELSFINLDELLSTSSLLFANDFDGDSTFIDESIGFTPENPAVGPGKAFTIYKNNVNRSIDAGVYDPGIQENAPLTIYQRTRDASSNQVTFFNISNLFYGKRILPGSLTLTDSSLSGSHGAVSITIKDDGRGTLYRADCFTTASKWNSVGTVFYDEGIIAIKSPHLYFFGKEGFDLSFKGEQNMHVMTVNVLAGANQLNSSSNPNWKSIPPSLYANEQNEEFVYITGINFHDDNMNVVMKTQLAQPIVKRQGSKLLFKCKLDF